jgi:two-component system, NarL family, response regulator DevR
MEDTFTMIQILAIDDRQNVGTQVCSLLKSTPDLHVACEVSSLEEAARQPESLNPDVIVLSLKLSDSDGISVVANIRLRYPEAEILLLSNQDSWEAVHKAFDLGVRGYVFGPDVANELLGAVRAVSQHRTFLSTSLAAAP